MNWTESKWASNVLSWCALVALAWTVAAPAEHADGNVETRPEQHARDAGSAELERLFDPREVD